MKSIALFLTNQIILTYGLLTTTISYFLFDVSSYLAWLAASVSFSLSSDFSYASVWFSSGFGACSVSFSSYPAISFLILISAIGIDAFKISDTFFQWYSRRDVLSSDYTIGTSYLTS